MNISYNWLKEYVNFDLTPEEVAAALTSIGLETGGVEEVQTIKGGLEGIVIGEVLTCEPHPNSDHMHVTTVNLGQGEPVQIVCGAANVAAGQKVVVATLGQGVKLVVCRFHLLISLLPHASLPSASGDCAPPPPERAL